MRWPKTSKGYAKKRDSVLAFKLRLLECAYEERIGILGGREQRQGHQGSAFIIPSL